MWSQHLCLACLGKVSRLSSGLDPRISRDPTPKKVLHAKSAHMSDGSWQGVKTFFGVGSLFKIFVKQPPQVNEPNLFLLILEWNNFSSFLCYISMRKSQYQLQWGLIHFIHDIAFQVKRLEGDLIESRESTERERKLKENSEIMVKELENAIEKEQERAEEFKVFSFQKTLHSANCSQRKRETRPPHRLSFLSFPYEYPLGMTNKSQRERKGTWTLFFAVFVPRRK